MPILPQRNQVFAQDRRLAMLTLRRIRLMEVEMAEEPLSRIAVFSECLALHLRDDLALFATLDALEALAARKGGLGVDFQGFEARAAGEADEA